MLRQTGRFRTLDRDLLDVQERKLFEYFIVVALHKPKAGAPYLPEVTQQFPLKVRSQNHNTEAIPEQNLFFIIMSFNKYTFPHHLFHFFFCIFYETHYFII